MHRARKSATLFISTLLAMAIAFVAAAPASAAPSRSDGTGSTVIFVHGFDPDGAANTNCESYWRDAISHFEAKGWNSRKLVTFGYYSEGDTCTHKYNGTRATSITTVAKALANRIYTSYTSQGKKVDVVAHSMGGLVIRSALYHVNKGTSGFPSRLYVEDVVTLGTPHDGANKTQINLCKARFPIAHKQCSQMHPDSTFLRSLPETPSRSQMGTDWTAMSSADDGTVGVGSGVGIRANHKTQYNGSGLYEISHSGLKEVTGSNAYRARYYHKSTGSWSAWGDRPGPINKAYVAAYAHRNQ